MAINNSNETAVYTDRQFVEGIIAHRPKAERGLYLKCKEAFAQETANFSGMRDSDRDNIVHEAFLYVWQKILNGENGDNSSLVYYFLKVAMDFMGEVSKVKDGASNSVEGGKLKTESEDLTRAEKAVLAQRRSRMAAWDKEIERGKLKAESEESEIESGGPTARRGWWHGNYFKIGVAAALVVVAFIVIMSLVTLVPAKQKKIEKARVEVQEEEVLPVSQILGSKEIRATFPLGEVGQILLSERYDDMLQLIARERQELKAQRQGILSEDNGASSDEKEDMLMVVDNQLYDMQWFEIVSLVGTNQIGDAKEKLQEFVEIEGQYQEVAMSLQKQIE